MTKKELKEYKKKCLEAFSKWEANHPGKKLAEYECPECHHICKTVKPTKDQVDDRGYWDGAVGCYECGAVSWKKI